MAPTLAMSVTGVAAAGQLGRAAPVAYVGSGMAALLDLGAMVSAFGAALGGVAVGSRMLFALARDGLLARRLSGVSQGAGAPAPPPPAVMGAPPPPPPP